MTKKINKDLTAEQKLVLFEDGTEPPNTSELNQEKREGSFHCANCGEKLFESSTKYESGSGWPSFYQSLP
ncbi:peptide-methionine (R)-S-oxide reductase, partial [Pelagibacterales bacterium SAG-MED46]|nr:peptide-methionine (R)-S-oxide reductase [Pelagibacterales bacterium SAG-MED46]